MSECVDIQKSDLTKYGPVHMSGCGQFRSIFCFHDATYTLGKMVDEYTHHDDRTKIATEAGGGKTYQ